MRKYRVGPALLFICVTIAVAQVYRWVDEKGDIHFGDSPPKTTDAEELRLPEGPSEEEVSAAQADLRRSLEARRVADQAQQVERREAETTKPGGAELEAGLDWFHDEHFVCFTPLSAFVESDSAKQYAPITLTQLTDKQQSLFKELFGRIGKYWQGKITDVACKGKQAESDGISKLYDVRMVVHWDARKSQLELDSDSLGKDDRSVEDLVHNYKVGDSLYIRDGKILSQGWTDITAEGNKVEIMMLEPSSFAFLIKRRVNRTHRMSEIRYMELTGDTLSLKQIFFANDETLTGWRTWVLNK